VLASWRCRPFERIDLREPKEGKRVKIELLAVGDDRPELAENFSQAKKRGGKV